MKWGAFMVKNQKRNAGFSLVELIIVVAIMAVLVGVIAPQWLKYVERSRRVTDVQNAGEIRDAFERVAATDDISLSTGHVRWNIKTSTMSPTPTNVLQAVFLELGEIPVSAVNEDFYWGVYFDMGLGTVEKVYLVPSMSSSIQYELYPDPSDFLQNGAN